MITSSAQSIMYRIQDGWFLTPKESQKMKIGQFDEQINFYGFAVNSTGVIGEIVAYFDKSSEIRKRYDASKIVNYIPISNKT